MADVTDLKRLRPRIHLSDEERRAWGLELKDKYEGGTTSIRKLAREYGRSYGSVHHALSKAGAQFAPQGSRAAVGLSGREARVLRLLADGGTPKSIAVSLGTRVDVVHGCLWRVRCKAGASGRSDAHPAVVEAAYDTGLLEKPVLLPSRIDVTERQRELIGLLARGLSVDRIAATLGCRPSTALAELEKLERALGAMSPAHVITRARQHGLPTSSEGRTERGEGR
ncbi:helix-turn-helix domain-containing protein [Streptomyces sp. NPDC004539]|uniref:helix-turn-helix domain-containing protein n=1 Tax=Streptomyces sp. NPDC004539 TaxID=3154280 RepID=UPI00339DDA26